MTRAGFKDLILPTAVVAVVGMMVFPLPKVVLDALLMFNIAFALTLLVSSVYLSKPEKFTALPTVLLLSTLFRLGLNVSTTRQILSTGSAPDIVSTFGSFVVYGNLIVGVVIFLIITLVQFIVIAKGAERVAEVAARFTLDAMPGKQMSIDADIRSGILSLTQAREMRLELQKESKLFGALDGAMKFVKGDAIAGLVITVVNISAGLIVGVSQHSLSFTEALSRFTLFTIGDGLVSQIPALLVAVAAGIAVTRVNDKEGSFVGRELIEQIGKEPQAIAVTGLVLLFLAMIPGLPSFSFISLAVAFAVFAAFQQARIDSEELREKEKTFQPKIYSSIVFRVSREATLILQQERKLTQLVQDIRNEVFERWGLIVPDVQFDLNTRAMDKSASILVKGIETTRVVHVEGENFSSRIASSFAGMVEDKLSLFIDDTHTRQLLDIYQPVCEDLSNHLIPEKISVTGLTAILRELLQEKVPISEFAGVLQAISEFYLEKESGSLGLNELPANLQNLKNSKELRALLEKVRIKLARTISRDLIGEPISVLGLPTRIDSVFAQASATGAPVPVDVIKTIIEAYEQVKDKSQILLCSSGARSLVGLIFRDINPELRVLAYEEILTEVQIDEQVLLPLDLPVDQPIGAKPITELCEAA